MAGFGGRRLLSRGLKMSWEMQVSGTSRNVLPPMRGTEVGSVGGGHGQILQIQRGARERCFPAGADIQHTTSCTPAKEVCDSFPSQHSPQNAGQSNSLVCFLHSCMLLLSMKDLWGGAYMGTCWLDTTFI